MHKLMMQAVVMNLVWTAAVAAGAQSSPPMAANKQVDVIFAQLAKDDSPGCAVAVISHGKIEYEKGYGMANLDYGIPISPSSVFYIASDSKQFTAFSIVLLSEQGKLSLADPITKYISELPAQVYGPVTIDQLIHHTSGVRDYWGLEELEGKRSEDPLSQTDFLKLMARQKELNFKPGDQYEYSNAGYALLAIVVNRVSGKELPEFAAENIFKPLGMEHTSFGADHLAVLKNRATSYHLENGKYEADGSSLEPLGDGGVRTTVQDLVLWDQNFYHNKLGKGSSELIKMVEAPGKLNNGKAIAYGFGLGLVEYKGMHMVTHSGSDAGYLSYMARLPEPRLSVICLCNSDAPNFTPGASGRKVLDLYLANVNSTSSAAQSEGGKAEDSAKTIQMSEQELARYRGTFREDDGTIWKLVVHDGKLEAQVEGIAFELQPLSKTHFRATGAPQSVELFFPEDGQSHDVGLQVGMHGKSTLKPIVLAKPTATELSAYSGEYYSEELDVTVKVYAGGEALYVKREHEEPEMLAPVAKDEFKKGRRNLKFGRDSSGRVSDLRLEAEGVSGVRFARKP